MNARLVFCVILFACVTLASAADAQSLRDARARDADARALAKEAVYTRRVCGNDITAEIDWASAGDWRSGLLVAECDKALGALEAACRAGDERAKSVTRFVCAGDGAGAEIFGNTLRYGAERGVNAFKATKEALDG